MNNMTSKIKIRTVAICAAIGGSITGGFTLVVGFFARYLASLGTRDPSNLFGSLIGYPADVIWQSFGLENSVLAPLGAMMNGLLFAAIINGLLGAFIAGLLAIVWQFLIRRNYENKK